MLGLQKSGRLALLDETEALLVDYTGLMAGLVLIDDLTLLARLNKLTCVNHLARLDQLMALLNQLSRLLALLHQRILLSVVSLDELAGLGLLGLLNELVLLVGLLNELVLLVRLLNELIRLVDGRRLTELIRL